MRVVKSVCFRMGRWQEHKPIQVCIGSGRTCLGTVKNMACFLPFKPLRNTMLNCITPFRSLIEGNARQEGTIPTLRYSNASFNDKGDSSVRFLGFLTQQKLPLHTSVYV